jgi:hypothetical protein
MTSSEKAGITLRTSPQTRRKKLLYHGIFLLALFHLLAQLGLWLPLHWSSTQVPADYQVYYVALQQLHAGTPLYDPWSNYGPHLKPMPYNYPPPFIAFLYPLGWLSESAFARLWYALLVLAFWIYAWCLTRLSGGRETLSTVLIAGLFLAFCPGMMHTMSLGNVQQMLTALWGIAFAFPFRGWALSAAATIKIHPLWPLSVAFIDCARQKGRAAAWREVARPALLFFSIAFLLGLLVCGPQAYARWLQNVPPVLSQGTFEVGNLSLPMACLRLLRALGWWNYQAGPLASGPRLFLTGCTLLGPLCAWWIARRWPADLKQSFVGVAVVLFAPLCWIDYVPLFLVPLMIWRREMAAGRLKNLTLMQKREVWPLPKT